MTRLEIKAERKRLAQLQAIIAERLVELVALERVAGGVKQVDAKKKGK